ncbi:hypothetical protein F0318_0014650 [Escherichia coli]
MARAVHRSGLVALGIATALMASCAFAAKDVVVAVGSNFTTLDPGNDSNLLIVFYVQIMPDDFVMQLHRF